MFVSHHSEIILNIFDKINVGSHWAVGRPNKERLIWQCKGKDKETLWERKSADNHYWFPKNTNCFNYTLIMGPSLRMAGE